MIPKDIGIDCCRVTSQRYKSFPTHTSVLVSWVLFDVMKIYWYFNLNKRRLYHEGCPIRIKVEKKSLQFYPLWQWEPWTSQGEIEGNSQKCTAGWVCLAKSSINPHWYERSSFISSAPRNNETWKQPSNSFLCFEQRQDFTLKFTDKMPSDGNILDP